MRNENHTKFRWATQTYENSTNFVSETSIIMAQACSFSVQYRVIQGFCQNSRDFMCLLKEKQILRLGSMHVTWRASSYQAQTSWAAELPVPCTHFFYALSMIMAGYVGVPCSYQQTLQNKGDHQQLQQLVHNNKTFQIRERSRFQSPESGPKHEAGRPARIIIM